MGRRLNPTTLPPPLAPRFELALHRSLVSAFARDPFPREVDVMIDPRRRRVGDEDPVRTRPVRPVAQAMW
jgi:hypothetical protein